MASIEKIDLSGLPAVSNEVFYPYFFNKARFLAMVGGAGSGKSHWAVQKTLVRIAMEPIPHRILVVRKVARTLRASVFQLFKDCISSWGWDSAFDIGKTEMTMTFKPTGATILFSGIDDQEKLKSITGITGALIEEATELSEDDLDQINLRIRADVPVYKQIILAFNPISIEHWLKRRFFDVAPTDRIATLRTTFRDNRFLDPEYRAELEDLKERNPSWWKIYGLGEWGVFEGLIYNTPIMDVVFPEHFDDEFYGLDFGFNNPSALVWLGVKDKRKLYIEEKIYQSKLTTSALIERMREEIPEHKRNRPIYADTAEPATIEEIRAAGFNCMPADKTPGSVLSGVKFCQGLEIHTLHRNANLNAEFSGYVWEKDKNGKQVDAPVKFKDHLMDAFRYGAYSHLARRRTTDYKPGPLKGVGAY